MDEDAILQLKNEIERRQRETLEAVERSVRLAPENLPHLDAAADLAKVAADTPRVIEQASGAIAIQDQIERMLATMRTLPKDVSLIIGDHPALRALEESAKLMTGQHPAFESLQASTKLLGGSGIESTLANYDALTKDIAHPLTSDVQRMLDEMKFNVGSVGDSIVKMFGRMDLPDSVTSLMPRNSAAVAEAVKAISRSLNPEMWEAFGFQALTDAARFNDVLVDSLTARAWTTVPNFDKVLEDALSGLSDSYADIFSSLAEQPEIFRAVPDFVVVLPPRDMVLKTEIVASRSVEYNPDRAAIDLADPAYARDDVDQMLAELDLEFVSMLDEVYETIAGNTIGRKRHVCASLRELCNHVLHRLSPNDEVKKWNSDAGFYKDGRPVRRLRLMYICRRITPGGFADYLDKTISTHIELLKTLNEMHAARPNLDEFQLRLLLTDSIAMLRFLLRTGRYNRYN